MKRSFAFAVGLVAASAGVLLASQQIPVFHSEANYIEVTARVVDRSGHFVEGLTASDFEIREDYRQERVETAFQVDLPTPWNKISPARAVLYRPDLAPEMKVAEGRVYLIYLNAIATEHIVITRRLAHDFVDNYLMPEDVVAMWGQAGGLMMFTNDKARLHKAIEAFLGTNEALTSGVPGTKELGRIEPSLGSALDWFSSVQGRKKSMLLFSAGWAGIGPVFSERETVVSTQTHLVDRADVQIYAVDTRGLVPAAHSAIVASRPSNAVDAAAGLTSELQAVSNSVTDMRWLAEDSGGFAIVNHNDYQNGFKRIVDENSEYYVLGYQSTAKKRPNWDYREITVKVTRPGLDGVRVQARKGYVAR
jgi:VWFA-related protein